MKYYFHGNFLYASFFTIWRGFAAITSFLVNILYRHMVKCGKNSRIGYGVYISYPRNIYIGDNCHIGNHVAMISESEEGKLVIEDQVQIDDKVKLDFTGELIIRSNTLISQGVMIYTHDHNYDPRSIPDRYSLIIEADVWIGVNSIILASVHRIGTGSIIGAGSVVTGDIPDYVVCAGNPAKVKKSLLTR